MLARVFATTGQRDSAAAHYPAVARAWERADPLFQPRRQLALDWIARQVRYGSGTSFT